MVERHYDRQAVRRYMKSKEEEMKRKTREEREAHQRAQTEREQRLKASTCTCIVSNHLY